MKVTKSITSKILAAGGTGVSSLSIETAFALLFSVQVDTQVKDNANYDFKILKNASDTNSAIYSFSETSNTNRIKNNTTTANTKYILYENALGQSEMHIYLKNNSVSNDISFLVTVEYEPLFSELSESMTFEDIKESITVWIKD